MTNPGTGEQPHCLAERNAFLTGEPFDFPIAIEGRRQPVAIDFDPFAAQQRQTVGCGQKLLDFRGRQRLAIEHDFDRKIEQLLGAHS